MVTQVPGGGLTSVEQSLVEHVGRGEWLDLAVGDEAIDEAAMRSWSKARTCRATVIREILRGRLAAEPDPHGLRLRGARITGRPSNIAAEIHADVCQPYDLSGTIPVLSREFITQRLNSAQWMIQAIEQRRQTMLKVMNFIVDRQRDFFEKGIEYLKPLTLREVAEVINMHDSTVSRVTNEKWVQTPRGVLPLKFFFSSALSTTTGEDASARAIRAQIEKLVADESEQDPLTDQQIVQRLRERGVHIARRTVAKYRDQLGILSARMRRRV